MRDLLATYWCHICEQNVLCAMKYWHEHHTAKHNEN